MDIDDKLAKLASSKGKGGEHEGHPMDSLPKRPGGPKVSSKAPKIQSQVQRMRQRAKPLLEGINTPVKIFSDIKPGKPQQNVSLADEPAPKLVLETDTEPPKVREPILLTKNAVMAASKRPSHKGLWWFLVIVLILAGGYYWASSQAGSIKPKAVWNYFTARNYKSIYQSQNPNNAVTASVLPLQPRSDASAGMDASATPPETGSSTPSEQPVFISTGTPSQIELAPQLTIKATPTGYLNVREQPTSSAKVVTQVHPGEVYSYTLSKSGWYQISLPNDQSGWISGQYVSLK